MEALGFSPAAGDLVGKSLITGEPIRIERPGSPKDEYRPGPVPVAADLKTPGSPAHRDVTKKIEAIADDPALTDKQKRAAINALRKQFGLSKGDMKKYFTKPLERAYAAKIAQLKASGIDTPEKAALLERLESKKKLYNSMYKAGGCVKKVFGGIGKGFKTIGKVALGVAAAVFNPFSLIPLVGQIPGVGKVIHTVSGALSKAKGVVDGAVDKVSGWVDKGVAYYNRGVQIYREASELPKRWVDEARGIFWGE